MMRALWARVLVAIGVRPPAPVVLKRLRAQAVARWRPAAEALFAAEMNAASDRASDLQLSHQVQRATEAAISAAGRATAPRGRRA